MNPAAEKELRAALKVLLEEDVLCEAFLNLRDVVTQDYPGNVWEHPRVEAFASALATLKRFTEE